MAGGPKGGAAGAPNVPDSRGFWTGGDEVPPCPSLARVRRRDADPVATGPRRCDDGPVRSSYHMTPDEFRRWGHETVEWVAGYLERVESLPVLSAVRPGDVRAALPVHPP